MVCVTTACPWETGCDALKKQFEYMLRYSHSLLFVTQQLREIE
jgi:hypothetical protein